MLGRKIALGLALASLLAGCGLFGGSKSSDQSPSAGRTTADDPYHVQPDAAAAQDNSQSGLALMASLFGIGGDKEKKSDAGGPGAAGVGVNSFLWRATLDTVSFMPLASADPFGGVIISEWYSPAATPNERFKVNIFILGRELRADGVRATVFRQKREQGGGQWVDAPVDKRTGEDLENAILTRARQMRLSTAAK